MVDIIDILVLSIISRKCTFKVGTGTSVSTEDQLLCVDGQQRCTTQLLLIAAIRDISLQCTRLSSPSARKLAETLIDEMEGYLVMNVQSFRDWAKKEAAKIFESAVQPFLVMDDSTIATNFTDDVDEISSYIHRISEFCFPTGCNLDFDGGSRFVPSYVDRSSFFENIIVGRLYYEIITLLKARFPDHPIDSLKSKFYQPLFHVHNSRQRVAKNYFDEQIRSHLQHRFGISLFDTSVEMIDTEKMLDIVRAVQTLAANSNRMSLMYCEILSDVNLAQVFLWLQEKTLFGMGALLYNPTPGVNFRPSDLVRNLLLSSFMNRDLEYQEEQYRKNWLDPIESKLPKDDNTAFDKLLLTFLDEFASVKSDDGQRYVGTFESKLLDMSLQIPSSMQSKVTSSSPIGIYARFHSYAEKLELDSAPACRDSGYIPALREETCLRLLEQIASKVSLQ